MYTPQQIGTPRAGTLAALVAVDGASADAYVAHLAQARAAVRDLADAVHSLCALHGGRPGVIDHALGRAGDDAPAWLAQAADDFALERAYLARLTAAAGPIPSTPGQAESEAAVAGQRRAFEMLVHSDRSGCAIGAAATLVFDWRGIRHMLDAAARRFGIDAPAITLPDEAAVMADASASPAIERAHAFAAGQVLAQHRGLWRLLEARASARAHA